MIKQVDTELTGLFDRIFDLPVDWEFERENQEVSIDVLEEFSKLAGEIGQKALRTDYQAAITFLWSTRRYVGISSYNNLEFKGTEVSEAKAKQIAEALHGLDSDPRNFLGSVARSGPTLGALLLHKDRDHIFELILDKERVVLRNWGLNQQSTEIIVSRLRAYRYQILLNLNVGGSVSENAIGKACVTLSSLSNVPLHAYRQDRKGVEARFSSRRNLVRAKDKLIGLATLLGDAAPLILGKNLDVVNFFSAAAGATTMAILPRGAPKSRGT